MELRHHFSVPASLDETWAIFNDVGDVAGCFPGASIESVTGDRCEGSVKVKLGPISVQYNGSATFVERVESERRLTIHAAGKDRRGQGSADATLTVVLSVDGEATLVDVTTDLAITGKPAQFGRGMIQDVSDKYLGQFVHTLSDRLQPAPEAPPEEQSQPRRPLPPPAAEIDVLATALPALLRRNAVALAAVSGVLTVLVLLRLINGGRD